MIQKLGLYYNSLKYLKSTQIKFRLYYMLRGKFRKATGFKYDFEKKQKGRSLSLLPFPLLNKSFLGENQFKFLNKEVRFDQSINWDYADNGKLWTYNLNYFDYLHQEEGGLSNGKELIDQYIDQLSRLQNGNEPYCISLRLINWVKYLSINQISEEKIDYSLRAQADILIDQLEYHIMGNHLLENGFGLFFAAYYFNDERLFKLASKIVKEQLEEQTMGDGAHYELSPMYHQIILLRTLDCFNLAKSNPSFDNEITEFLKEKASLMLSWLSHMTFSNGQIPLMNDAAFGITPDTKSLFDYANTLGVEKRTLNLKDSGYRAWNWNDFEMIMDVGEIGPWYIPGHAHSDIFNFEMTYKGKSIFVDTGTGTYDICPTRIAERCTEAHNTVKVGGVDQSQVWASFRVGKRASITSLQESDQSIEASHNGYKSMNCNTIRSFNQLENGVKILDKVSNDKLNAVAYFHFHPDVNISLDGDRIHFEGLSLSFVNANSVKINSFQYAPQFNLRHESKLVEVHFNGELESMILQSQ